MLNQTLPAERVHGSVNTDDLRSATTRADTSSDP